MSIFWSFSAIQEELTKEISGEVLSILGDREREYLGTLRFEKRRSEWIAGRIALKRLILSAQPELSELEPSQIQIIKAENGAPFLLVNNETRIGDRISLSHSNGYILNAYSCEQEDLGIDLERIEKRPQEFIQDFFTQEEIDQVLLSPPEDQPLLATLIWSAKEAVLKALMLGLKVDTRKINIHLKDHEPLTDGWRVLGYASSADNKENLRLFWRREIDFVLTTCVMGQEPVYFVQIKP